MRKALFFVFAAALGALSASASAQLYKWIDQDGKVRYGDVPPPGAQVQRLKPPPGAAPAPAPSAAAKPADKGEKAGKRPEEAQKDQAQAEKEAEAKRENCARAQETLRTLESGQRIARVDAKGERYYLEDAQIAQEVTKARQSVQQWCG